MVQTDEQKAIIRSSDDAVINAGAGTAKTTTLIMYAKARPNAKILYIVFNRSMRIEAKRKFAEYNIKNVTVHTAHSLAYGQVKKKKVVHGFSINQVIEICGIKAPNIEDSYIAAKMILDGFNIFCNSTVNYVDLNKLLFLYEPGLVKEFGDYVKMGVRILAKKMRSGIIPYTHDFYLKLFQLSKPKLPYTHILFDEGQDASPVMLDIFMNQAHATKVIVGDTSQAIYGYRMATNALQTVGYEPYFLTKSFRFGQYNARMANNILSWKKDLDKYTPDIVNLTGVGGVNTRSSRCYLSRGNIGVLENLINEGAENIPQSFYLEGGVKGYSFFGYNSVLNDVLSLYFRKTSNIKNPFIKSCVSVTDLQKKADRIGDAEIRGCAKLVNIHGGDLRKHIRHLKGRMTQDRSKADVIFSTVHKSKGLEYDEVILGGDFVNYSDIKLFADHYRNLEKKDIFAEKRREELNEEINILYVAVTRSKNIIRKAA